MTSGALRGWRLVHRWTSLVSTLFLLMLCITGLPLVLGDEIEHWAGGAPPAYAAGTAVHNLDKMVARAHARFPTEQLFSIVMAEDEGFVRVYLTPSWAAYGRDRGAAHWLDFDARSGSALSPHPRQALRVESIIATARTLHTDMFAALPGRLTLAAMAILLILSLVSGTVIYGPFTRKLAFGAIRSSRSRSRWLDLHNLLGIATVAWLLIVGATGAMNEITTPLFRNWQQNDVAAMLAPWRGQPPVDQPHYISINRAAAKAARAAPGMTMASMVFPGHPVGSPHHFLFWMKGESALSGRLLNPILVDARTGAFSGHVAMPFHLRLLQLCRPLHFGDYGGMPLKILWALLDVVTIVVLGSGLYLWIARPRRERAAARAQGLHGASPAMEPAE